MGAAYSRPWRINDVVVNRGGASSMIELRVTVGGHFVANQRADGLIIASADRFDRLCASAGGAYAAPGAGQLGDGAHRASHAVQPAGGAAFGQ